MSHEPPEGTCEHCGLRDWVECDPNLLPVALQAQFMAQHQQVGLQYPATFWRCRCRRTAMMSLHGDEL